MIPDRWTLREWGRYTAVFAAGCYLLAELLDRVNQTATHRARDAVAAHEFNRHEVEDE